MFKNKKVLLELGLAHYYALRYLLLVRRSLLKFYSSRSAPNSHHYVVFVPRFPSPTIMSYSYQGFYSREKLFFVQMAVCPLISVFSREKKKLCPVGWHLASSFHP
uniref:Uncharacterized protein n=1 Tax=Cacopsylla melanoneura TaxID=428564 RepID=A0A8D8YW21_9HEMI